MRDILVPLGWSIFEKKSQCCDAADVEQNDFVLDVQVRMLEPEYPNWHRLLALEALKLFCSQADLLYFFFVSYDQGGLICLIWSVQALLSSHMYLICFLDSTSCN